MAIVNLNVVRLLAERDALHLLGDRPETLEVSPMIGRSLAGTTPETIRAAVDAGALPATRSGLRKITIASLAAWHGRSFDIDDWQRVLKRNGERHA